MTLKEWLGAVPRSVLVAISVANVVLFGLSALTTETALGRVGALAGCVLFTVMASIYALIPRPGEK